MADNIKFMYSWTIENYSKLVLNVYEFLESPTFVIDQSSREWCLQLYAYGIDNGNDGIWCFLSKNGFIGSIVLDVTFQLVDVNGTILKSKTVRRGHFRKKHARLGKFLIKIEDLYNNMKTWTSDVLIVRCLISYIQPNYQPSLDCKVNAKTKFGVNHRTFKWSIEEPNSSDWSPNKVFNFTVTSLNVRLTLFADELVIEIKYESWVVSKSLSVTCKITLLDVRSVLKKSTIDTYVFKCTNRNCLWKFPTFINKKTLKNCIKNGFFTLILEFIVPNGIVIKEKDSSGEFCADATATLQNNLKQMLLEEIDSDVKLKVGDEQFMSHRCLLSSRSPVFRAMFTCDMLESQRNTVDIKDIDSQTLQHFLEFLYTGKFCAENCDSILKLLLAADKYQVESLTEECANKLMSLLSPKNVCDIITVADMVKHKYLKISSLELLEENASDILPSDEWSEWAKEHIKLASEIISRLSLKCKHKSK